MHIKPKNAGMSEEDAIKQLKIHLEQAREKTLELAQYSHKKNEELPACHTGLHITWIVKKGLVKSVKSYENGELKGSQYTWVYSGKGEPSHKLISIDYYENKKKHGPQYKYNEQSESWNCI